MAHGELERRDTLRGRHLTKVGAKRDFEACSGKNSPGRTSLAKSDSAMRRIRTEIVDQIIDVVLDQKIKADTAGAVNDDLKYGRCQL